MPSGTVTPAGGGGGSTPVVATYPDGFITAAHNAAIHLPFASVAVVPHLLDLTDPQNPLIVTTGLYAVTVTLNVDAEAGKSCLLQLVLGNANQFAASRFALDLDPYGSASLVCPLNAGDTVLATGKHNGAGTLDFYVSAVVCKIG